MALVVFLFVAVVTLALHFGVGALLGLLAQFAVEGFVGHTIGQSAHWMAAGALAIVVLGRLSRTTESE